MKRLIILLSIAYITLISATAQTVDLFNREGKDIIPKEQFITFYKKDVAYLQTLDKKPIQK